MNKSANPAAQSCDSLQTVLASKFTGPDPQSCSSDVLAYNVEHGPILKKSFERLKKCVAPMPTCNLQFMDLSCSSFGDADEVKQEVAALQAMLGPNQTVTVCGNFSDNYTKGCNDFASARKQLIITSTTIDEPIQDCAKANTYCAPPKLTHPCRAADGTIQRQRCCAKVGVVEGEEQQLKYGAWGTPGGFCAGSQSCPPGCEKRASCKDENTSSFQECIKLEGGEFTCLRDEDQCSIGGRVCSSRTGKCEPPPTPAATSTPGNDLTGDKARAKTTLRRKSNRAESLAFLPLDRAGRTYGIDRAILSVATERANLLGSTSTAPVTGAPGFGGVMLRNVDVGSTLGLLRFRPDDIIHFVNDTPISNADDLSRALRSAKPLTTITYTRDGWRWVLTLMIRDAA